MQAWSKLPPVSLGSKEKREDIVDNSNTVIMDDEVVDAFIARFECALVGRLLVQRIHGCMLEVELHRRWDKFGKFCVTIVNNDCFLCVFDLL